MSRTYPLLGIGPTKPFGPPEQFQNNSPIARKAQKKSSINKAQISQDKDKLKQQPNPKNQGIGLDSITNSNILL